MSNGSWLDSTPPKTAFIFGIISGLAAAFIPGFFVLVTAGSGGLALFKSAPSTPTVAAAPAAPSIAPDAEPTSVTVEIRKDDHIRGNVKAALTIVEYSDFQCPFCQRFAPTLQKALDEYKDKVRLVYRHFPLDSIHPYARPAAEASECASEQGKFWEYHDALFARQDELSNDFWVKLAGDLKLDVNKFKSCFDTGKYKQRVETDSQDAVAKGGRGTPYTIIGTTPISGALPYESIKQVIDQALK